MNAALQSGVGTIALISPRRWLLLRERKAVRTSSHALVNTRLLNSVPTAMHVVSRYMKALPNAHGVEFLL